MRTEATLDALCTELTRNCGDFFAACRTVQVSPTFVRKWQKDDKEVDEQIQYACEVGALQLESAAITRAVHGVEEDVYYQGGVVGQKTNYSDGLLMLLMKKRLKGTYGDEPSQTNVNLQLANNVQVMPRAGSYDEWLSMARATTSLEGAVVDVTPVPAMLPAPQADPRMADIL